jgi:hypothetical protein
MPYVETLKVLQTGNTSVGIFETMALLLNVDRDMRRVSFVRDRGVSRLSVGDSLELASPTAGKQRKKRWWEQEKETGQLRLPFSLYEPAKIIHVSYDNSRRQMKLKLRFVNVAGVEKTITFYNDGHARLADDGIKAIRVHEVIKKWVGPREEVTEEAVPPFSDYDSLTRTSSSGQRYSPSRRDCEDLVERAMEHGIAVTTCHWVYDDVTGEYVGNEFQARPFESEVHLNPNRLDLGADPIRYISFRRLDGRYVNYRINHSRIRFVEDRTPSGTECRNMLEVAMGNGIVVTPAGKVYDKENGIFLGDCLQLTSEPQLPTFDNSPYRCSEDVTIHGDMVMPDGGRWGFQTYASKVTHIDNEVYTSPAWGERERRRRNSEFASLYGGPGSFENWANSSGPSFDYSARASRPGE